MLVHYLILPTVFQLFNYFWRRWGTSQDFLLAFIDELWKTWKIRTLKKWKKRKKNCWGYHHFTHRYQIPQSYEVQFLRYEVRSGDVVILNLCNKKHDHTQIWSATDKVLCHFRSFFALLPNYWLQKLKLGKNVKTTRRHYPFTHVYPKSWSYHVWFLRFKVQRTEFFLILGHFLPFDPPNNPQNQNFEKQKHLEILSFYACIPQMTIAWCIVPEISSATDRILSFWAIFCPFTPITIPKIKTLKKWKELLDMSFYTWVT